MKAIGDAVSSVADKLWMFIREQLEDRFGPPEAIDETESESKDDGADESSVAE